MNKLTLLCILLVAGGTLAGCARAPQDQLAQAVTLLAVADSAEADLYVADQYLAAQDSLAAAQAEIEYQNSRFALTRDYSKAENLLAFAIESATTAQQQVEVEKDLARAEADSLLAEARAAAQQVDVLLTQAPRGKEGEIALVSIGEDASTVHATLAEATQALEAGNYAQARTLARTALEKAQGLIAEMNSAIEKVRS